MKAIKSTDPRKPDIVARIREIIGSKVKITNLQENDEFYSFSYFESLGNRQYSPKKEQEFHKSQFEDNTLKDLDEDDRQDESCDEERKDETDELQNKEQDEEKPQEKMTLPKLLDMMHKVDDGILEATPEQMKELGDKLMNKIDSIKFYLDKIEADIMVQQNNELAYRQRREALEKQKANFENFLLFLLRSNKLEKMPGDKWTLEQTSRKSTKCVVNEKFANPTQAEFLEYSEFMSCKYSWNLTNIKNGLKKGNEELKNIACLLESTSHKINWQPKTTID